MFIAFSASLLLVFILLYKIIQTQKKNDLLLFAQDNHRYLIKKYQKQIKVLQNKAHSTKKSTLRLKDIVL